MVDAARRFIGVLGCGARWNIDLKFLSIKNIIFMLGVWLYAASSLLTRRLKAALRSPTENAGDGGAYARFQDRSFRMGEWNGDFSQRLVGGLLARDG
jgi:hypothetical protein